MSGRNIHGSRRSRRARTIAVMGVIAVPVVVGLALLGLNQPRGNAIGHASTPSSSTPPVAKTTTAPAPTLFLARSLPVRLEIPTIGVGGGLQQLGLNANDRTIQLPKNPDLAGWYTQSSTPGQSGLTVVLGYINSRKGPGVFRKLNALKVSARIDIRRTDGKEVVYRVDKIASYPAKSFPTAQVYAPTTQSALRIITCGGTLRAGQQPGNVVVYAHQTAVL